MALPEILRRIGVDADLLGPRTTIHGLEVDQLLVEGADAVATWTLLRSHAAETGRWPLLLGFDESIETFLGLPSSTKTARDVSEEIEYGEHFDAAGWLGLRSSNRLKGLDSDRWPENEPARAASGLQFAAVTDYGLRTRPRGSMWTALVPVRESWQVPAVLGLGGFNSCPTSRELVAICKYFANEWGAHLATIGGVSMCDSLEFFVERPPQDRVEALRLGRLLFALADWEGNFEGPADLGASLLGAPTWHLWWD